MPTLQNDLVIKIIPAKRAWGIVFLPVVQFESDALVISGRNEVAVRTYDDSFQPFVFPDSPNRLRQLQMTVPALFVSRADSVMPDFNRFGPLTRIPRYKPDWKTVQAGDKAVSLRDFGVIIGCI